MGQTAEAERGHWPRRRRVLGQGLPNPARDQRVNDSKLLLSHVGIGVWALPGYGCEILTAFRATSAARWTGVFALRIRFPASSMSAVRGPRTSR